MHTEIKYRHKYRPRDKYTQRGKYRHRLRDNYRLKDTERPILWHREPDRGRETRE